MNISNLQKIQKAIRFAVKTHEIYQKQKRKGKDISYITHPLIVGLVLSKVGADDDLIIAGILHDTIEDSVSEKKVTFEMIKERFGENVAKMVLDVTEKNRELPWEERKKEAIENIKTFSYNSLLLKSADIFSNLSELIDDYNKEGEEAFLNFNASKEKIINNYFQRIDTIINRWPENPLATELQSLKDKLDKIK